MARRGARLLLLLLPAAAWAQEPPAKYEGRTAAEWVERLPDEDQEAWDAVQAIGAPCVPLILDRLVATGVSDDRLECAIEVMGARAAPPLLEAAKRGKPAARILALHFLLLIPEIIPGASDLVPALLADGDRSVRMGAALELCDRGFDDVSALPPLMEALQSSKHRAWAAELLARFPEQGPLVAPALVTASRDENPDVRRRALSSLWVFWETRPEARGRLLEASESEDPVERAQAVPEWGGGTREIVRFCLKAAADEDDTVRFKARDALVRSWRGWISVGENADQAFSHPWAEIRRIACEAVTHGDAGVLTAVLARLTDKDEDVQAAAIDALGRIGDTRPAVREQLHALLEEGRTIVGESAAWALIRLDLDIDDAATVLVEAGKPLDVAAVLGKRATVAVPALREMLDAVPLEAAWALYVVTGETDAPVEALRGELQSAGWWERMKACQTARLFGPAAAPLVPLLTRCLDDEETNVRRFAATALGYVGAASQPAIPKLIALLDDHEDRESEDTDRVSSHAAAALAWLDVDTPKMKEILSKVVEASDGNTRPGALRYFWKHELMPVEEVVRRCRDSLGPPNWEDILPILRLLAEIGAPAEPAIPDIEELGRRERYEIRAAAADAISRIRPR